MQNQTSLYRIILLIISIICFFLGCYILRHYIILNIITTINIGGLYSLISGSGGDGNIFLFSLPSLLLLAFSRFFGQKIKGIDLHRNLYRGFLFIGILVSGLLGLLFISMILFGIGNIIIEINTAKSDAIARGIISSALRGALLGGNIFGRCGTFGFLVKKLEKSNENLYTGDNQL